MRARLWRALSGALAALIAAAPLGCGGETGVISITLVSDPDSDVLSRTQRVRLTLDDPETVAEATRGADGSLSLELEVDASNSLGFLRLEAFEAGGDLVGVATSAPIPLSAIDGPLALYVAEPLSVGAAPVELDPPRAEMAFTTLPFGLALAGGRTGDGELSDAMQIYNVYDHDFQTGLDLPSPRASATMMNGAQNQLFIYSGASASGDPLADLLVFNTGVAPAGAYVSLTAPPALARIGAPGARVGDLFVVLGDPAVQISGITGAVSAVPGDGFGGTITPTAVNNLPAALVAGSEAGASAAVLIVEDLGLLATTSLAAPEALARSDHSAASLPNGDVIIIGGRDSGALVTSAVRYIAETAGFSMRADVLATPRLKPAVAATDRYLIVAGGEDISGVPLADLEVFDVDTLDPVAVLPLLVARSGATATPLGNGQVMIAGGRNGFGEPIPTIELFSPD